MVCVVVRLLTSLCVCFEVYDTYKDYGVIEAAVAPVALYLVYVVVGRSATLT